MKTSELWLRPTKKKLTANFKALTTMLSIIQLKAKESRRVQD